ncbi:MAG: hypothetical protein M3R05_05755, partial [Chloroflexota bacterium]|nr:hypothetical protein [Chloroflexota bacterium]
VNIAARVCALAAPGELLITETVRGLVRTSMPLTIEPRGRRRLKGIREPIALFAVRPTGAAPGPRSRRLRSFAASRLQRRPVVAAFAALVGVAIVATVVLAIGLLANANAEPGAGRLPVASRSGKPTLAASEDSAFPNAAERALQARIDPAIARLCDRAPTSDYPKAALPGETPITFPVQAGLRCALGGSQPDAVILLAVPPEFTGAVTSEFWFGLRVSLAKAPVGDCATDDKAYLKWSYGLRAGKLLCTASQARARIDWIFDGQDLIATGVRDDGDGAALYRWWIETGRVILH